MVDNWIITDSFLILTTKTAGFSTAPEDIHQTTRHRTIELTPWGIVLLKKLTGPHLVKKFPAFYITRRFITAFASALHLTLCWAISTKSIPPHPTSCRSLIMLFSHRRQDLRSGFFPSCLPTKTLNSPLLSPIRATCLSHLFILDFITRIIYYGKQTTRNLMQ
jgi:hypothetical protein